MVHPPTGVEYLQAHHLAGGIVVENDARPILVASSMRASLKSTRSTSIDFVLKFTEEDGTKEAPHGTNLRAKGPPASQPNASP